MSNDAIIAELNHWSNEDAHINYRTFSCQYYDMCNGSVGNALCEGKNCSMSYVGRDYGVVGSYRLVVVGMDHGEAVAEDFETRRLGI